MLIVQLTLCFHEVIVPKPPTGSKICGFLQIQYTEYYNILSTTAYMDPGLLSLSLLSVHHLSPPADTKSCEVLLKTVQSTFLWSPFGFLPPGQPDGIHILLGIHSSVIFLHELPALFLPFITCLIFPVPHRKMQFIFLLILHIYFQ